MNHEIQRIDKPIIFRSPAIVTWPANIKWDLQIQGDAALKGQADHFRYSRSWDGTEVVYQVPAPRQQGLRLEQKPKMWRADGLWHVQHPMGLERGTGTTKRWAYKQYNLKRLARLLRDSSATITISEAQ